MRIRILPLLIIAAFVSIVVKLAVSFMQETEIAAVEQIPPPMIMAEYETLAASAEAEEGSSDSPQNTKGENIVRSPNAPAGPQRMTPSDTSRVQEELYSDLAKRREELQVWSDSIALKESVLNATEKKINIKLQELKQLQTKVSAVLDEYKIREDKKTKRLIKIYEQMKPKDAAGILNDMEITIVLEVLASMKERNVAPILAAMDPFKAREITVRLAKQGRL